MKLDDGSEPGPVYDPNDVPPWALSVEDIAGRIASDERDHRFADAEDLQLAEEAFTSFAGRIRGSIGGYQTLALELDDRLNGQVIDSGDDWLILEDGRKNHIIRQAAIVSAEYIGYDTPEHRRIVRTFASVLRELRDEEVRGRTRVGDVEGVLYSVGSDYLVIRNRGEVAVRFDHVVEVIAQRDLL